MAENLLKSDTFAISLGCWLSILVLKGRRALVLTLLGGMMVAGATDGLDEKLEAAIHREVVLGELKGAMADYQSIIHESHRRPLVARALYRYARCLDKLERRSEAYSTYETVLKDFSDEPEAALSRVRLAKWKSSVSGPTNLNFEQGATGKLPDAWFVPALPDDADHWAQLRRTGCMNHDHCAVVLVPENAPLRAGNLMQSFSAAAYRGKNVRLTAWLRLDTAAAGDHGQMWMGVDRADNRKGFFDDMSDRAVVSADWTFREIRARIDDDATSIKFGIMSIGRGRVWVDRVSFEVIPEAGAAQH